MISRVHLLPFSQNPLYHGYAGLIAYQMYRTEVQQGEQHPRLRAHRMLSVLTRQLDTRASAPPDSKHHRRSSMLLRQSLDHFAQSLRLSESHDLFIRLYVEVGPASRGLRQLQRIANWLACGRPCAL